VIDERSIRSIAEMNPVEFCNATLTTPSSTTIGWRGAVVACHVRSHRPLQQCFLQQQLSTITQCTGSVSRCVLRSPVPASLEDFCARVQSLVGPQSCVPDRRHCRRRHWHSFHLRLDDGTALPHTPISTPFVVILTCGLPSG
jgi:hypothetical protein